MYLDPKPYGDMVNQYLVGVDAMGLGGVTGKNHSLNRRVLDHNANSIDNNAFGCKVEQYKCLEVITIVANLWDSTKTTKVNKLLLESSQRGVYWFRE